MSMTAGDLATALRSMSENLRYAAGRIQTLEKQAAEREVSIKESSLAQTLIQSGFAKDEDDARDKLRKLASKSPVEVAADMLSGPMDLFVSDGDAPGTNDIGTDRILTPDGALAYFRGSSD